MSTKIEWCEETWNPVVGCSHCSPGCDNCYAERMANRLAGIALKSRNRNIVTKGIGRYISVIGPDKKWNGSTQFDEEENIHGEFYKPLRFEKPKKIFVVSMGDLFHQNNSFRNIDEIVKVQYQASQHTYLWLTKHPDVMGCYIEERFGERGSPKNMWCGVTVCNQEEANYKIPILLQIPASVLFISIEPMLGQINLNSLTDKIDWVIVGGESGPNARPMHPDWVRSIRYQCKDAGIPFLFKQWGDYCYPEQMPEETYIEIDRAVNLSTGEYNHCFRVGKKKSGRFLDGDIYDEYPIV